MKTGRLAPPTNQISRPHHRSPYSTLCHLLSATCTIGFLGTFMAIAPPEELPRRSNISADARSYVRNTQPPRLVTIPQPPSSNESERILPDARIGSISATGQHLFLKETRDNTVGWLTTPEGTTLIGPQPLRKILVSPREGFGIVLRDHNLERISLSSTNKTTPPRQSTTSLPVNAQDIEISPDEHTVLVYHSFPQATVQLFESESLNPITSIPTDSRTINQWRWIRGHDLLLNTTRQSIDELINFTGKGFSHLSQLNKDEQLRDTTPTGNVYVTNEPVNLEGQPTSSLLRFKNLEGSTLAKHTIASSITDSHCSTAGDFAFQATTVDHHLKRPTNRILVIRPPYNRIETIIAHASHPRFTPNNTLTYYSGARSLHGNPTQFKEYNLESKTENTLIDVGDPIMNNLVLSGIFCIGLSGMILLGIRSSHNRWKSLQDLTRTPESINSPDLSNQEKQPLTSFTRNLIDNYVEHPLGSIALCTAIAASAISKVYQLPEIWNTVDSTLQYTLTFVTAAQSLLLGSMAYIPAATLLTFKRPRLQSLRQLNAYDPAHSSGDQNGSSVMSSIRTLSPAEEKLYSSLESIARGALEEARTTMQEAIEKAGPLDRSPSWSSFHIFVDFLHYLEHRQRLRIKDPNTAIATAWREYNQAWQAIHGNPLTALKQTPEILSHSGPDCANSTLHQARIHHHFDSIESNDLWKDPIHSILSRTPRGAFKLVPGGTSEVLTVDERINPIAGRTLIIKRSTDGSDLHKKYLVTQAISRSAGRELSSTPLAYFDPGTITADTHESLAHFAILYLHGLTLSNHTKESSKEEITDLLSSRILPQLAVYHTRLRRDCQILASILKPLNYARIFSTKFVERVTKDPIEREQLLDLGAPVISYIEHTPSQPVHNDLHASNVILSATQTIFIDPEDATIGHCGLDVAHLLYDPSFGLDHGRIILLQETYRRLCGSTTDELRRQDAAATWFKLCHLVGRDRAYGRPSELASHCRALMSASLDLGELDLPGVDRKTMDPLITLVKRLGD